ncbi:MAG: DNA polymerase IV [Armatimonadota bacterium]|nr:DNA polymerase IV [Armatimonadota bacterium]
MPTRSIIHLHIDSFLAEIERQRRPDLSGRPIVVIRSRGGSAGVVVSVSAEAGNDGVTESMTARHAQRLCPEAQFIAADYQLYREIHAAVMDIASVYTPLLEPYVLDSAYLDVSACGSLFGTVRHIAAEIKQKVKEKLGFEISAGIGTNKLVASAASYIACPARILEVEPGKEREFLAPLPVRLLWGVGEKIEKRLADLGVHIIGQLASIPERFLVKQFGPAGSGFHKLACGIDYSSVLAGYPPEIIKIEQMFPTGEDEIEEPAALEEYLPGFADRLAEKLRRHGRFTKTLTLKLHLCADGPAASRVAVIERRLKRSIDSSIDISSEFRRLLCARMESGMKVSGISLVLKDLSYGENSQLSFMSDKTLRMRQDQIVNAIKDRFGERAIFYGVALAKDGQASFLRPAP